MGIRLYEFETALDGGEGGGAPAAPAVEAPAAEPAAAEPSPTGDVAEQTPAATEPEAGEDGPSLEDLAWEVAALMREQGTFPIQQQQPQFQQPGFDPGFQQGYGPPQLPELDPYDPESVVNYLQARDAQQAWQMQQMLDQRFGPIAQRMQAAEEAEIHRVGTERSQDILANDVASNGDFAAVTREDGSQYQPGRELALNLAESFMPAAEERYGVNYRAAEAAIAAAAQVVRDIERTAAAAERTRLQNHNATLAGAPNEPSSTGMTTGIQGQPATIPDPAALARKYSATA